MSSGWRGDDNYRLPGEARLLDRRPHLPDDAGVPSAQSLGPVDVPIDEHCLPSERGSRREIETAVKVVRANARELGAPADIEAFVEWMKTLDYRSRTRVEAMLVHATAGFVPDAADREAFDLAGWDELRLLDRSIITIGSHTMTHPVLPSMSAGEIEAELRDSRRMIEAKLAPPAEFFSYPNGDCDERTLASVRRHYRAAVNCNSKTRVDTHLIPNVHLPSGVLALAWKLNHPQMH